MTESNDARLRGEGKQNWMFEVGDVVMLEPEHQDDSVADPAECKITDRFIDVDTGSRYYKFEVVNVNRYIDHLRPADTTEKRYHKIREATV